MQFEKSGSRDTVFNLPAAHCGAVATLSGEEAGAWSVLSWCGSSATLLIRCFAPDAERTAAPSSLEFRPQYRVRTIAI